MKKMIPQPLVRAWCWLRYRHAQTRYAAWDAGTQVIVYTCRCGQVQSSHVLPANRRIRRGLRK